MCFIYSTSIYLKNIYFKYTKLFLYFINLLKHFDLINIHIKHYYVSINFAREGRYW